MTKELLNLLAIESSSPVLTVALKKGASPAKEKKLKGFVRHAENLLPLIDTLLRGEKISISEVDVILLGRGPGSFTGLRVGFATVKGILAVHKKDCFGGLSLDMTAENASPDKYEKLCVAMDARRDMIYARFYESRGSRWIPEEKAAVLSIDELSGRLHKGMALTGDALGRYRERILAGAAVPVLDLPEKDWYPKASVLIKWFEDYQRSGKRPAALEPLVKPEEFIPLYFRLSEAEERAAVHAKSS